MVVSQWELQLGRAAARYNPRLALQPVDGLYSIPSRRKNACSCYPAHLPAQKGNGRTVTLIFKQEPDQQIWKKYLLISLILINSSCHLKIDIVTSNVIAFLPVYLCFPMQTQLSLFQQSTMKQFQTSEVKI